MKKIYNTNKAKKKGEQCICPSCNSLFIKEHYQQVFCKTKPGTQCKDKYWNTVTPEKYNNTTRISPSSKTYMDNMNELRRERELFYDEHPFSSEALGQD